jgi:glycosyltransferase involved in cell wall biosynthesis
MDRPMSIRVLHLGSPNGLYGAERWILALVRHLDQTVESHVGVILDAPDLDPPLLREAMRLGLATVAVDAPGRFNLAAVHGLRDYIRRNRIDILHTHFYKTDLIGLLAARGTACKLVTTPHGWSTQAGLALRLYEALDRLLFRCFDAVAPLSPDLMRELEGKAGKGLRYIQNGVDIGEIDAAVEVAPEAQEWKARADFIIGYVGQLISRKGIDTLLKAFAKLPIPKARLVLIGEGPQRVELWGLARSLGVESRVDFLGYRKDRLGLLRGFDVFALPSLLEGIPRCLMESMAAGVPIVSSDIPGSRELIDAEITGLMFTPGDTDGLLNAITRLADPALRRALADAARDKVVQQFSAGAMARSYIQLYTELAARVT